MKFFVAFAVDAGVPPHEQVSYEEQLTKARHRIEQGQLFMWKDQNKTVSMAGVSAPTRNGIRVNAVYTPPEYRGNGYASANVAATSQRQLEEGYSFCFLYTDASNPVSNKIYQRIGYEYVCNSAFYLFQ